MKRILVVILLFALVPGTLLAQKKESGKVRTLVIDPGHGGDKPGAIGKHCQEKDLTLAIAKNFGKLVSDNFDDVKVIYTRTTDVDVSLAERAKMANRNKADLFVSIHINSHPTAAPSGVETFVMGLSESKANLEVAKKENADILLEANYQNNADYQGFDPNSPESNIMFAMYQNAYIDKSLNFAQAIQNQYKSNLKSINRGVKQAELYVLYKTAMPSVLTEVGFISNPTEEAFMMSKEGQAEIALCIFNAFATYKAAEEGTKKLTDPKIDLPGYGKNKPAPEVVAEKQENPPALEESEKPENSEKSEISDTTSLMPQPKPQVEERPLPRPAHPAQTSNPRPAHPEQSHNQTSNNVAQNTSQEPVYYRVQFLMSDHLLGENDRELKGQKDYDVYQYKGSYNYTKGNFTTLKEALVLRKTLQNEGFKDAWVIPFYKGRRISHQEAKDIEARMQ
ncbi:MAG: N-acetylmuramoyl-L-alanine amidase [Bacteroidales bacterium]|nr:N-acetylmuramoyl-L-alanine amidase [Bacteroidales bacterium]